MEMKVEFELVASSRSILIKINKKDFDLLYSLCPHLFREWGTNKQNKMINNEMFDIEIIREKDGYFKKNK